MTKHLSDNMTMKDLPVSERPYELCEQYGPQSLTDAQLLAVILKTGTREVSALQLAQQLLVSDSTQAGLASLLYMKLPDFQKIKGIGKVKAVTMACVVELGRRLSLCNLRKSISFTSSESVAQYYMTSLRQFRKEHFLLLLLDSKNALIKEIEMSVGTVNASLASSREIMMEALRYEAVNIILLHNHPSGDATPSTADIAITKKIAEAGQLLDIKLVDHIVVGEHCYTSLRASHPW